MLLSDYVMWIDKFIQYLRIEKNYSPHTVISYLNDLTQFEHFIIEKCGVFDPVQIDADLIRIWIAQLMEANLTARTANRKLSAVKSFYTYLKKKSVVAHNPAEMITGPKVNKKLPVFVKNADMQHLLDDELNWSDSFKDQRDRFIIELLYVSGMRCAELIALKDSDIDFTNCTVRVTGKRNKQRIIPFSDTTRLKMSDYIRVRNREIENKGPFLFVKQNGGPLYPSLVYNIVHRRLNSIPTLSKKSPHVLRHSFATEMLNNGAEINAVKELLGHSSLASTEVYTHVSFEELKKVYNIAHPRAKK